MNQILATPPARKRSPLANAGRWWLLFFLSLCVVAPAGAANYTVLAGSGGLVYFPATLTIVKGDSVTFRNSNGYHNVVADDGSFRCANGCDGDGHGGSGNASPLPWHATVTFTHVGTFDYFCEPHSGMHGQIIVLKKLTPVQLQSFVVE